MAYVIGDGCIKCGSCAANCPVSAISEGDDKFVAPVRRVARLRRSAKSNSSAHKQKTR